MIEPLLTRKDVARLLQVHPNTIYRETKRGRIRPTILAGQVRFEPAEVRRYIKQCRT